MYFTFSIFKENRALGIDNKINVFYLSSIGT